MKIYTFPLILPLKGLIISLLSATFCLMPENQLTTSHFVLKKLDHVVISARPRHLEFEICLIMLS